MYIRYTLLLRSLTWHRACLYRDTCVFRGLATFTDERQLKMASVAPAAKKARPSRPVVVTGQWMHETNTFSKNATDVAEFECFVSHEGAGGHCQALSTSARVLRPPWQRG